MSSSRGRTARSIPLIGIKRGKSPPATRSKKKQKRLQDICDSPVSPSARDSPAETNDGSALRRSTRARKVTFFPDFSPEPFYPKIGSSGNRGDHVTNGRRLRLERLNVRALDAEIASTSALDTKRSIAKLDERNDEDDDVLLKPREVLKENVDAPSIDFSKKGSQKRKVKGGKSRNMNQISPAPNYCEENRVRDSPLEEQEISAVPSIENEKIQVDDVLVEDQGNADAAAPVIDSNKKGSQRMKSKGRKSKKRSRIPQTPKYNEENRSNDPPLKEQGISALPSVDNEKDQAGSLLEEKNGMGKIEDNSHPILSGGEEASMGNTDQVHDPDNHNQFNSGVISSTADCKFYSRRISSKYLRVFGQEATLEADSVKNSRIVPSTSSEEDLADEKDETSTERAFPEGGVDEENGLKEEEASSTEDMPRETGSRRFNPSDGEETEQTPCLLENGIQSRIRSGGCATNLSERFNSQVREGRRCGLCGGGTDGKPVKKLMLASAESDHEHYNRTSSSEEPTYDAWDGFGDESDWLGKLLGPIRDRHGVARVWVHQQCAVWSPEVYFAGLGRLKSVRAALSRGKLLKCSRCGRAGATIGCRVDRCPKTYHLPCARAENSIFDHRKFLIACSDHRHLFQPHGNLYLQRIKKIKTRKMKFDLKKLSHEASRKDLEAEEKWLENCGEDEEFLKREGKRLHRDIQRIAPTYIGGNSSACDMSTFKGWESVAGLSDVIQCLKEVVILPLLYPEVFASLSLSPPRGVLLHGYPGTGKTHVVRALIGECARGDIKIAYFARKGADCLGKYVGDAERQLRLLFQVAEKSQPSIIFFDEIDGLAPCRSKRQDQTHNSVVATLLSLLDGLKSRGSVVVIGATNRPDYVDPALRRPGRFDREIYFPLPSVKDRSAILSLQTKNWPKPLSGSLLSWVSKQTPGFAGADLQALCTHAAMIALKRNFPLHEILRSAEKSPRNREKPPLPFFSVLERDWLSALASAPPPCSRREAGMAASEVITSPLPTHLTPCLLLPLCHLLISLYFEERIWIPPPLFEAAKYVKDVIIYSLEKMRKPVTAWRCLLPSLLQKHSIVMDIERLLSSLGLLGSTSSPVPLCDNGNDLEKSKLNGPCFAKSSLSFGCQKPSGFRVLITGNRHSGQRHLASCLLDQFQGHVYIQKVNLSILSQEGRGDIILGITQVIAKCANVGWCVMYMPRLDLWAVNAVAVADHETCESSTRMDLEKTKNHSSSAWDTFVEHMDSICGSSSLIVLGTCELPHDDIPSRVREFFANRATSLNTIPRFFVQVGGIVDLSVAFSASASQISRDIIMEYIQMIHRKAHASNAREDVKFVNISDGEGNVGGASPRVDKSQLVDQNTTISTSPLSRNAKGSLYLAIAALGYQILQYPQFAELCWATSKVKAGPIADVSGPWKIWPFNSCIILPQDISEKAKPLSVSKNSRNKSVSGLARGLVAVGLLAYRGDYSSVREVSSQVRVVLELLVGLICEKIQSGKDCYRYTRILSQVAYIEDMVNSWAYSLRLSGKIDEDGSAPLSCDPPSHETQAEKDELVKNSALEIPDFGEGVPVSDETLTEGVDSEKQGDNIGELFNSESLCFYDCCTDCLQSVKASVQEIVTCCWEAGRYPPVADCIHDIVTICSMNLISAMRKKFLSLDDVEVFPSECSRHAHADSATMPRLKFHLRDGVLLTSDPPGDAEFHCKLGKLCLHFVEEVAVASLRKFNESGSW